MSTFRYEADILTNPLTHFGVWTPEGWRVNQKRFEPAAAFPYRISADGQSTNFKLEVSGTPQPWAEDLHDKEDLHTDGGIYPCDPRVTSGRPRWAVSHTLMCHRFADHGLHTHEYLWDAQECSIETKFREHVPMEKSRTDAIQGLTVKAFHTPLSLTIEGNKQYSLQNSAVRGVWDNPEKKGKNYYTHRVLQMLPMQNWVYIRAPFTPVVQCYGIWPLDGSESLNGLMDENRCCPDSKKVAENLNIELEYPALAFHDIPTKSIYSPFYQANLSQPDGVWTTVPKNLPDEVRKRVGRREEMGRMGYHASQVPGSPAAAYPGYDVVWDFNQDGVIDEEDVEIAQRFAGKKLRSNLYSHGYFGGDWLSTGHACGDFGMPATWVLASYEYGGGYNSVTGEIHLLESPGPGREMWIEYFYDKPAEKGATIEVTAFRAAGT